MTLPKSVIESDEQRHTASEQSKSAARAVHSARKARDAASVVSNVSIADAAAVAAVAVCACRCVESGHNPALLTQRFIEEAKFQHDTVRAQVFATKVSNGRRQAAPAES